MVSSMPIYLEVAVNIPRVSGVFHYHLPPELEGQVQVGHLVIVPFGQQTVQGVVLDFVDQPSVAKTRPVSGLVDQEARLTKFQMELARHLADVCLAPLAACLTFMGKGSPLSTMSIFWFRSIKSMENRQKSSQ